MYYIFFVIVLSGQFPFRNVVIHLIVFVAQHCYSHVFTTQKVWSIKKFVAAFLYPTFKVFFFAIFLKITAFVVFVVVFLLLMHNSARLICSCFFVLLHANSN